MQLKAEHLRINRQGYDSVGNYWGVGEKLYLVYPAADPYDIVYVRAPSAVAARQIAKKQKRSW